MRSLFSYVSINSVILILAMAGVSCVNGEVKQCGQSSVCAAGYQCAIIENEPVCLVDGISPRACGNNILETSEGEVCDDGNIVDGDGCRADCRSNETCGNSVIDLALGETCDDGNNTDGDGCSSDCQSNETCGNGILDTAAKEVCDDGNNADGDGCRADCLSDETCGNGEVDRAVGEACDDKNRFSHDGTCSSTCQLEELQWTELTATGQKPSTRRGHAMAYDAARGRVVLFGGRDSVGLRGDTWEWDGAQWLELTPKLGASPEARENHAMAYDATQGRVLLFGGWDGAGHHASTWEWDGARWILLTPDDRPTHRRHAKMVYDAARERIVLFGGRYNSTPYNDTWEWDGTNWQNVMPQGNLPLPRSDHEMIYNPAEGKVMLFGGSDNDKKYSDTWEWDGTAWRERTPEEPGSSPTERSSHTMVYDAANARVVLFGGCEVDFVCKKDLDDTWIWNGERWTSVPLSSDNPPARFLHDMVYDHARQRVVLFGGIDVDGARMNDTWELDGTEWSEYALPDGSGRPIRDTAMAYDAARGRLVLFGGHDGTSTLNSTWEWDGTIWREIGHLGPRPSPRIHHAMAYDAAKRRVILFGGHDGEEELNDTWQWDGQGWSEIEPNVSPSPRRHHAMAYDTANGRVMLFGGDDSGAMYNDTWQWDGDANTWAQASVEGSRPLARNGHAMAYDQVRRRVVLFGGFDGDEKLGDTWEWDGTAWSERTPTTASPIRRSSQTMAYNAARGCVVLFGGRLTGGRMGDAWEWDGINWTTLFPFSLLPEGREDHAMAYEATRGRLVIVGGIRTNDSILSDTWSLQYGPRPGGAEAACVLGSDEYGQSLPDDAGGCSIDDCWGYCTPSCPPGAASCDSDAAGCGDGVCNQDLETSRLCPADCPAEATICGDLHCDADETVLTCPGDCGN